MSLKKTWLQNIVNRPKDKILNMIDELEGGKFKSKGSIYDRWSAFEGWRRNGHT